MNEECLENTVAIRVDSRAESVDLSRGARVGAYEVDSFCSQGGFGAVYRAKSPSGADVAIKLLHRTIAESPTALRRFEQEIAIVRALRHPSIVEIVDVGDLNGRPYLVMEWLEGLTLDQTLRAEGALPLDRAISIIEELCHALAVVHAFGVVHRDIKGANVMLLRGSEPKARVKLLDFGVAKLLDQRSSITAHGARIGTSSYMAPEQILGQRVGPETDIYAIGVLLFAMVTGRLPFIAPTAVEVEGLHINGRPPRASQLADAPEAVSDVILRCLSKKPFQRYPSVEDLASELRTAARASVGLSSLRAGHGRAVAVFIEVDSAVEEPEVLLARARQIFLEDGLDVALEDEEHRWLLGVAGLPGANMAERDARARSIKTALSIIKPEDGGKQLRAVVHAGPVTTLRVEGSLQLAGGELLAIEDWSTGGAPGTVEVTAEVLSGIEAGVTSEATSHEGRSVVRGVARAPTRGGP